MMQQVTHSQPLPYQQPLQPAIDSLVQQWKDTGGPTWTEIVKHLPFVNRAAEFRGNNAGVIKLSDVSVCASARPRLSLTRPQIPFGVKKPEIVAIIGEKAPMVKMPPETGTYAIHIIMERSTAKSYDCFVEFETLDAAVAEYNRLNNARRCVIGCRKATVELSDQSALMGELFPKAKCVQWIGINPNIVPPHEEYSTGFQGFVSGEEMHVTARIAQNPSRVSFVTPMTLFAR